MAIQIREIDNKEEWENFLLQQAEKTFLQSWNWGEFNKEMGSVIWRIGAYDTDQLLGVVLVYKISARRGTFLFIPHGPVVKESLSNQDKKEILGLIVAQLSDVAKKQGASFIRVSPIFLEGVISPDDGYPENENIFLDLGFRRSPIHMHPEVTWELDITLPEEKLLANMRKTTRYLIRQAEKNPDIQISVSDKIEDLKLFWPVYVETAKRHHFVVFPEKYLEAEFNSFIKDREILIFLGKYKGEVVSSAIFVFWQGICFYHHSGSLSKYNKIPVSYLLQWRAIQEAKIKGCKTYNFWGIAPDVATESDAQKSRHPWAGLSLFKMGFGGCKKNYVKTQDFVISQKYWINYLIEKIRKRKRNL
ncbi:MAG: peptidoglycan bridge formation glycyltransferase FemA/FemB family protein [Candidatus Staskawiczbacteria bacterium]|nr:peptidoglycan bridge formation glycyltransferase FemA/FemB family protein [Candidatus Staskawiczbacteria bacterium]